MRRLVARDCRDGRCGVGGRGRGGCQRAFGLSFIAGRDAVVPGVGDGFLFGLGCCAEFQVGEGRCDFCRWVGGLVGGCWELGAGKRGVVGYEPDSEGVT